MSKKIFLSLFLFINILFSTNKLFEKMNLKTEEINYLVDGKNYKDFIDFDA